ncbi:hypothetical protein BUALT_Bualt13G0045300 [Buddleja alternifolia]|uniref:Association with the SNF1 complex (ASC) domain-containing protein n=1 Tax=Buddleja alternifolia TaxID=168488 RepID=A0AAV6WRF8_9LAMI|nr:hypothetical protein BUALT_Bualt13G0045300 [Buddleja alternifolia]
MGNANGREDGGGNGGRDGGDLSSESSSRRVASADLLFNVQQMEILLLFCFYLSVCSRHLMFSSPRQVPVVPIQRDVAPSLFNSLQQNASPGAVDHSHETGIPTIITWSFGGNNVAVEGSWDSWRTRKILQRSGKDHSILLVLPSGIYRYRFIVDGEVRCIPDLPCETDETGRACNLIDVHDYVPENLDSVAQFEVPPSPDSSYSQEFPLDEDFSKDPLIVPPQLQTTALGSEGCKETSSKPQHVVLNHLFIEKGWSSQSVVALGLTHRFQSKYVTVVLYKPLKR